MSASEAIDLVKDGETIVVPSAAGEPPTLLTELSRRRREFHDVTVAGILATGSFDYFDPETADNARTAPTSSGPPPVPAPERDTSTSCPRTSR